MSTPSSFVHLHQHSEFSMLDGAARVADVVKAAVQDGQPALGITDHGNMYGALDFYKACTDAGIKPIIGQEFYQAKESRNERPKAKGKADDSGEGEGGEKLYYHLTLLAETTGGYKNLIKLSSQAYLDGFYYKPRSDWEMLSEHHEGIIASTGCLGGLTLQNLLKDDFEGAVKVASRLQDIFGKESLFVELQDHNLPEQHKTNPELLRLAKKIGAPLLATNDSHYVHKTDAPFHDALLCVQTGAKVAESDRFHFSGDEFYLKSAQEMRTLFFELPEACDNTLLIAERANVEIDFNRVELPKFPLPPGFDNDDEYLRHLVLEGSRERYGATPPAEVTERLEYELGVISQMGFSAYFLVVWDLIRYARDNNIRVGPGRGSAAGCCVSYCLRITNLDPLKYGLIFERFLNIGRKSMPDIDMDFDSRYRDQIIRYATDTYGWDHVAQIVTFSTIKARAAVRDASRVLGYSYGLGDKIAKLMPPLVMGRDTPLAQCLERDEDNLDGWRAAAQLRELYEADGEAKHVIDVARGLEGLRRQDGIHAAAVVITREPLTEYLPIQRKPIPKVPLEECPIVTQYEGTGVEKLGLLKMDFLGLRNLDVIEMTLDHIEKDTGERLDIDSIPLDDEKVFEMLRKGDSIGTFQMEGSSMRGLLRELRPTRFEDIAALIALYRPGPMANIPHYVARKHGREEVSYIHSDLKPILEGTYGVLVFQESVLEIANKIAGFDLTRADEFRAAVGKKKPEVVAAQREAFLAGCIDNGYDESIGLELFRLIEPFANYGFNASHAYGYALIGYQTAWLKANYPVEYLAALLTSISDDKDRTAMYLHEGRKMGVKVLVPDINVSIAEYSPTSEGISFGMSAIRNVGAGIVELIVKERESGGPFVDFNDFCRRVPSPVLNKKSVAALILAGAFDSLGHTRKGLIDTFEKITKRHIGKKKDEAAGVMSLFDDPVFEELDTTVIQIPNSEFDIKEQLTLEKEMLGLYLSGHPLRGRESSLAEATDTTIMDLIENPTGSMVTLGGILSSVTRKYTKKGDIMATATLEDLTNDIPVVIFPRTFSEYSHLVVKDGLVRIRGRIEISEEETKFMAQEISELPEEPKCPF